MLTQTHTASSRSACRGRAQRGQLAFSAPRPITQRSGSLVQQAPSLRVTVAAGKLDSVSLFGGDTASLLGGAPVVEKKKSCKDAVMEVELGTTAGIDYTTLRDHLANGEFREAEDETRALLIKLAGPEAVKRNWVYFTEVKNISVTDFQTLDSLWKASSNGKFGYSVQKEIWVQNTKRWPKFFKQIDWTQGENNNYRKWPMEFIYSLDAPRGHLPLTNALRGTQLFQAIMEHPAFEKSSTAKTLDQKAAEAAGRTQSLF
ncbi:hypothetical protein HYH02_008942 [Chlamydomonas schloesseri]|uniref:GUN4-like domain-containing protein n=1 Tax=Chlamydomonas schloesseri TaxID=2026947 RepID=A0A835WCU8_9CHLO|nr:hypothetical protein HYH02_008942 [Chlamydomonas schloesseri]|eukprot:KAG2445075.1 hypothetical protein HYH02_008942 [Chlamydomonas schloesseri]